MTPPLQAAAENLASEPVGRPGAYSAQPVEITDYFQPTPKRSRPIADAPDGLVLPSYVQACERGSWRVLVWDGPGSPPRWIVYRCNSWRHAGPCARRAAQRCYARTSKALTESAVDDLVYAVLTVEQRGPRKFREPIEAYRGLSAATARVIREIRRAWPGEAVEYVATVERHRSGWPHVNIVIRSSALADYVRGQIRDDRRPDGWLRLCQRKAGFGPVAWWEPVRNAEAIADYVGKVAGEFLAGASRLTAECVKLTQLPENAPRHMRRIRSSRGFLPLARREKKCFAGILVRGRGDMPEIGLPDADGVITGPTDDGPIVGSRVWYEGHLRKKGLTIDEHWMIVPAEPEPEPDDRAAFFGRIEENRAATERARAFYRGLGSGGP